MSKIPAVIKITAAVRATVKTILSESSEYDPDTLRIERDGMVTALKDADKTFAGNDPRRWYVGYINDMVDANGVRREGW